MMRFCSKGFFPALRICCGLVAYSLEILWQFQTVKGDQYVCLGFALSSIIKFYKFVSLKMFRDDLRSKRGDFPNLSWGHTEHFYGKARSLRYVRHSGCRCNVDAVSSAICESGISDDIGWSTFKLSCQVGPCLESASLDAQKLLVVNTDQFLTDGTYWEPFQYQAQIYCDAKPRASSLELRKSNFCLESLR